MPARGKSLVSPPCRELRRRMGTERGIPQACRRSRRTGRWFRSRGILPGRGRRLRGLPVLSRCRVFPAIVGWSVAARAARAARTARPGAVGPDQLLYFLPSPALCRLRPPPAWVFRRPADVPGPGMRGGLATSECQWRPLTAGCEAGRTGSGRAPLPAGGIWCSTQLNTNRAHVIPSECSVRGARGRQARRKVQPARARACYYRHHCRLALRDCSVGWRPA